MLTTKIRRIGNASGFTIPKKVLEENNLSDGDTVSIIPTENGILITPYDPEFEKVMQIMEEGNKRYKNALRELAK